jgi:hypothetical protein
VVVSRDGVLAYFHWGVTARKAFPELPKEEREFLISGTSPSGWRKLFGDGKDSEEDRLVDCTWSDATTDASRGSGIPGSSNIQQQVRDA